MAVTAYCLLTSEIICSKSILPALPLCYCLHMRHGFLLIDKPVGPTSHDTVALVRRALSEPKIGHLGTLDPAASGLLVLAVGAKALKAIELFDDLNKEYDAGIRFGAVSTTYDREGVIEEIVPKPGWTEPDIADLQRLIAERFIGKIAQVPPVYSAVKVGGERAYRKMRQGREVNLPAREVKIDACDILSYTYPELLLRVSCGSGTYIRSLAHDLGAAVRFGAYLSSLRRTRVGEWSVDNAVAPENVAWAHVMPLKEILSHFGGVEVTAGEAEDLCHGRPIARTVRPDTIAWFECLPIAILLPLKDSSQQARARKVL